MRMETNGIKNLLKKELEGDKDAMISHMMSLKLILRTEFATERKILVKEVNETREMLAAEMNETRTKIQEENQKTNDNLMGGLSGVQGNISSSFK